MAGLKNSRFVIEVEDHRGLAYSQPFHACMQSASFPHQQTTTSECSVAKGTNAFGDHLSLA